MTRRLIALALLLASVGARADDWGTMDRALLGTAVGALVLDWAQTRYVATHVETTVTSTTITTVRPTERNPLLGHYPAVGSVNAYFALAIAGTVGLSMVLDRTPRRWFLSTITVVETAIVLRNHEIGLKMAF